MFISRKFRHYYRLKDIAYEEIQCMVVGVLNISILELAYSVTSK